MNDAQMPNIILVTFDSLAAQDMSLHGYPRNTTPFIDRFADECYVFDNMRANSNSTTPSLVSILTGRYPMKHGYYRWKSLLTNKTITEDLSEVLQISGYRTAAVIGFRRCYVWINSLGKANHGWTSRVTVGPLKNRSISRVTKSLDSTFEKTLEALDSARDPFFLWLHLHPPHGPYLPSASFRGTFVKQKVFDGIDSQRPYLERFYPEAAQHAVDMLRGRYNENILEIDHKFGSFIESVRTRGLFSTSVVIVTSDHGEMFEKGYQGHNGPLLYDPLLRIPFLVRLPDGRAGRRVSASAEQVDIAPTILDLLGLEIPRHMHGESLVDAMLDGCESAKPTFSASEVSPTGNGGSYGRSLSVVFNGHKLILNLPSGACELYDLVRDSGEDTNIATIEPDMGRELRGMILERFANSDACVQVCHDRC